MDASYVSYVSFLQMKWMQFDVITGKLDVMLMLMDSMRARGMFY